MARSPSGGRAERLTNQHAAVNYPVAMDPRTLLYVARDADGGGPWLWSLDVNRKTSARISSGVDQYMSISASRDGRRVVATVVQPELEPVARAAARSACDRGRGRAVRPACSDRMDAGATLQRRRALLPIGGGTGDGLWQVTPDESLQVWREVDATLFEPVAVSPDGRELAVVVTARWQAHDLAGVAEWLEPAHPGRHQSTCKARRAREPSTGRRTASGLLPAAATPRARRCSRSLFEGGSPVRIVRGYVTTRCGRPRVI